VIRRLVLRRLGGGLLVLVGVSMVMFSLARIIPGDPAALALGPSATPEQVEALRDRLGLDRPLLEQYRGFVADAVQGDFGISLYTSRRVSTDLYETFPATFELVTVAITIVLVLGIALGVVSTMRGRRWADPVLRLAAALSVATPSFVWAIALMLVFGFALGWFPISGRLSEWVLPPTRVTGLYVIDALLAGDWILVGDALRHLVLPAVALSLPSLGQVARLTRTNMFEMQASPHVETMRAYGVSEWRIGFKYALRPASIATLTVVGLSFVAMFGNAFLVEMVFGWPGMARYGVNAILNKDLNAMMATVMVMTVLFVVVNALIDALIAWVDPRIRHGGVS
jgi:peptide/nickel transport system permease protein